MHLPRQKHAVHHLVLAVTGSILRSHELLCCFVKPSHRWHRFFLQWNACWKDTSTLDLRSRRRTQQIRSALPGADGLLKQDHVVFTYSSLSQYLTITLICYASSSTLRCAAVSFCCCCSYNRCTCIMHEVLKHYVSSCTTAALCINQLSFFAPLV